MLRLGREAQREHLVAGSPWEVLPGLQHGVPGREDRGRAKGLQARLGGGNLVLKAAGAGGGGRQQGSTYGTVVSL